LYVPPDALHIFAALNLAFPAHPASEITMATVTVRPTVVRFVILLLLFVAGS